MKLLARSLLAGSLGISAALLGGAAGAAPTPIVAPSKAQVEPHGLVELLGGALSQVKLQPQQQTPVFQALVLLEELERPVHRAMRDLATALADQLESGKVDKAALAPKITAVTGESQKLDPAVRGVLEMLHRILDPSQRTAFADAMKERVRERADAYSTGTWMDDIAKDIGLTNDQRLLWRAMFHKYGPIAMQGRSDFDKVLEAFKGDDFSLDELMPVKNASIRAKEKVQPFVEMAAASVGLLTPDQRKRVADAIRDYVRKPILEQQPAPAPSKPGTAPARPGTTRTEAAPIEEVGASEDPLLVVPGAGYFPGYGGYYGRALGYGAGWNGFWPIQGGYWNNFYRTPFVGTWSIW